MSGHTSGSPAKGDFRGRFWNRRLRRASFISPSTGERSKRVFTLRDASQRPRDEEEHGERAPLLPQESGHTAGAKSSKLLNVRNYCKESILQSWDFATSKTGLGILKCSLAYLIGSLATLVPAIAALIGHQQDSKHMVCTVTVWFALPLSCYSRDSTHANSLLHPARSIGSMHEATILAFIGLIYSGIVSFTSMGVSMFFAQHSLLIVGHVIVLIVFVGGGLGLISWVKQRLGHPLVNVACSLASLGCITILIKEGSVQAGTFSEDRALQVLLMVLAGIIVTTAVNVLVLPNTARSALIKDAEKNTDLLGEMLIGVTRAFLSGRESDLRDDYYKDITKEHLASLDALHKDLGEAKREYYLLGRERLYNAEARLPHRTECLAGLSQDIGGLRSAALAQFAFMNEAIANATAEAASSTHQIPNNLDVITEAPEDCDGVGTADGYGSGLDSPNIDRRLSIGSNPITVKTPGDLFFAFLAQLGPPTKSLVYTLKQILDELPWESHDEPTFRWLEWLGFKPMAHVKINEHFHSSLKQAIELYKQSRSEALSTLYQNRANSAAANSRQTGQGNSYAAQKAGKADGASPRPGDRKSIPFLQSEDGLADTEEVSACCGHFSFSLLDFAEDMLTYLTILDELKTEIESSERSWRWLLPSWRSQNHRTASQHIRRVGTFHDSEYDAAHGMPDPIQRADAFADPEKVARGRSWTYKFYKASHVLRRDDVRFAIKVGIGAILYALPAFIEESRPWFVHWRGEWGLVSYMAVCCMTIGASNTTSINRFIGTGIGACCAIVAWVLASDGHGNADPWLLGFFGWLMSLGCFYLIIAKNNGPMGRFILLTYNLGALYSYSLSVQDDDNDDDEGGIDPAIWDIVLHRLVAVVVGCIWAIIVTRFIWPISARAKLKNGLCVLWLRMGLVWKRDPLAMFLLGEPRSSYMDIREESLLQSFLSQLEGLRKAAASEYELKGPFPDEAIGRILERTGRMLDAFHAMNVVITKNLQYTPGEAAVLRHTRSDRFALSARISHLFSVLASSVKLEYPLNDVLPSIDHTRDRLLARISEFRRTGEGRETTTEQDYELLYAYVLVTGQLSQDIQAVSKEIESLYGTLDEDNLKLE